MTDSRLTHVVIRRVEYPPQPATVRVMVDAEIHRLIDGRIGESDRRMCGWGGFSRTFPIATAGQHLLDLAQIAGIEPTSFGEHVRSYLLPGQPARTAYTAALGLGSLTQIVCERPTYKDALEMGLVGWRITRERAAAKGAEGLPDEPVIVRPEPGESAWDALGRMNER